jgi:hypothetical protein
VCLWLCWVQQLGEFNFANLLSKHNTIVPILCNNEVGNKYIFPYKKAKPRILALGLTPAWKLKKKLALNANLNRIKQQGSVAGEWNGT